ncbi:Allantoicase [Tulasnella sp. 408]|nr:Allantoicase [Tulasnella sp. 408]
MAKYHVIDFEDFQTKLGAAGTELSSVALGGKVVAVSDDFFADVTNLIKVEPSQSLKGQFGPNGALFDGWESRRHNPTFDWCIIKLGTPGHIIGFDIDTAHFNGNEAPQASVEALFMSEGDPTQTDERWEELLPKVNLGPSSRHLYGIEKTPRSYTHVKLNMYPDGGIGRFRVYGEVSPIFPEASKAIDLAHVFSGGRVVYVSNQHFGIGPNLLLPGRGKDMGDGWETRRSRLPGHKDFVVIRLGAPGVLEEVEIDTAHFKGNFPESCELQATRTGSTIPHDDVTWTTILSRTKLGPHRRHFFQLENVLGQIYTHVRLTIYPGEYSVKALGSMMGLTHRPARADGGIKRIRVIGRRAEAHKESAEVEAHEPTTTPFKVPPPQTIALNGINGHVNGINGINGINGHHVPVVKRRPSDLLRIPAPIDFACVETQIGEPNNKMDCEILDLEQLGRDILKVKVPLF